MAVMVVPVAVPVMLVMAVMVVPVAVVMRTCATVFSVLMMMIV